MYSFLWTNKCALRLKKKWHLRELYLIISCLWRGVLNCLWKDKSTRLWRDIFTCRENEVSSVRSNLQYVLQVNSRIPANKWKSNKHRLHPLTHPHSRRYPNIIIDCVERYTYTACGEKEWIARQLKKFGKQVEKRDI